jgi:hypothetical protein
MLIARKREWHATLLCIRHCATIYFIFSVELPTVNDSLTVNNVLGATGRVDDGVKEVSLNETFSESRLTLAAARTVLKTALSKGAAPIGSNSFERASSITHLTAPLPAPSIPDTSTVARDHPALVGGDGTPLKAESTTSPLPPAEPLSSAASPAHQIAEQPATPPPTQDSARGRDVCGYDTEHASLSRDTGIPTYTHFLNGINRGIAKHKTRRERRRAMARTLLLPSTIQATVEADVVSLLKLLAPPHSLVS